MLRCAGLIEKAARAVHVAHQHGMVHRDLKPANVMVTAAGDPVVLDFGLVRFRELEDPTLTTTGDLLGTPAFMAPEQVAGDKARIDRRADVFGLGATLYALVTQAPGAGVPAHRARGRASRANPAAPRDLDAVLATALAADPDLRYATAEAFADDLARVARASPSRCGPRPSPAPSRCGAAARPPPPRS